jgi:hypothetical protein
MVETSAFVLFDNLAQILPSQYVNRLNLGLMTECQIAHPTIATAPTMANLRLSSTFGNKKESAYANTPKITAAMNSGNMLPLLLDIASFAPLQLQFHPLHHPNLLLRQPIEPLRR